MRHDAGAMVYDNVCSCVLVLCAVCCVLACCDCRGYAARCHGAMAAGENLAENASLGEASKRWRSVLLFGCMFFAVYFYTDLSIDLSTNPTTYAQHTQCLSLLMFHRRELSYERDATHLMPNALGYIRTQTRQAGHRK